MHIKFNEDEKEWIDLRKFGWPIRKGCPDHIKKTIHEKKEILNKQTVRTGGETNGNS